MERRSFIKMVLGAIVAAAVPIDVGPYDEYEDVDYLIHNVKPWDTPFMDMTCRPHALELIEVASNLPTRP